MQYLPMNHRVLVKRLDPAAKTPGGIHIPEQFSSKRQEAVVVSVGPGEWLDSGERRPMSVKAGDRVLIFRGHEITLDDQEYVFVNDGDIIATINDGKVVPLNDWVQLKRRESSNKTSGGVFIPDANIGKHREAHVVALGPGKILENGKRSPMAVRVGDCAFVLRELALDIDGQEYLFLTEEGLAAVIERS